MTTTNILDQLNSYDGDNIWQDIIYPLDSYSDELTEQIDNGQNDRFVADGTSFVFDAQTDRWAEGKSVTRRYAPYSDETVYSTRDEAVNSLRDTIGADADDFDLDAIADELVEWHTCHTERDGETVEWLPGNGYYIRQFAADVEHGDSELFWELVASHRIAADEN